MKTYIILLKVHKGGKKTTAGKTTGCRGDGKVVHLNTTGNIKAENDIQQFEYENF